MDFEQLKQDEAQYVMQTYGRFDLGLDHGQGALLYDHNGKEYIDLTSGIGVNSLGHNHPKLTAALEEQIHKLMEVSNLYYTQPMVDAARKLCQATGFDKVFFGNSGAEANEAIIKLARKYGAETYGPEHTKILTLKNSFHGRTVATLEATGQDHFHTAFFPFTNGFDYVEANNIDDLYEKLDENVCGILMELIQGESGVRPLDPAFVQEVAKVCREKDILLLIDEVQTGAGRTGSLFCYENYGIHPDAISMAKGLGGGVPIGGIAVNEKTSHVLQKGDHGSTFGANPLSATAASTVLDVITDPAFLAEVKEKGDYFKSQLESLEHPDIADVRGQGLMLGIQIRDGKVGEYIQKLMDEGVLVLKAGSDTIRLLPPLVISREQIDQAMEGFRKVFA